LELKRDAKTTGKTGPVLKTALHQIIDGHTVLSYTAKGNDYWFDGDDLDAWEALIYTESACPEVEPQCGQVQLLYLDEARCLLKTNGGGRHDSWDREYVWPKSRGFPKARQEGYTDLHHLRAADRNLNSAHSNYGYDNGGRLIEDKRDDGHQVTTEAKVDRAVLRATE
jgi:endonuclease I